MLQYIVLIIIFGFIYEATSWFFRIYTAFSWIKRERSLFKHGQESKSSGKLYVLIPALAEAGILEDTAKYFSKYFLEKREDVFLIIITTEKEKFVAGSSHNTIDVARSLASKYEKITHIHFPREKGKMAHQLNYAIRDFINAGITINDDDLIAVYNADSRPEKETFDWVLRKFQEGGCSAFQQYGCYTGNILDISRVSWAPILVSGSLWQTRWSLGFEIYNSLKQLKFQPKNETLELCYPLNYCIGHGLFITKKLFEKTGGFTENTHNEDAIFGLQLSDMQEILMPVPYFDVSESPDTLEMLYIQKSNWYFGPLQAYSYAADILGKSNYGMLRKLRLVLLSTKLFSHAIFWIAGPTLMFLCFLLAIVNYDIVIICLSLLSIMLFAAPSFVSYTIMVELGTILPSVSFLKTANLLLKGFILCYIMHGISAYKGLYKYLIQLLSGKDAIKEKTIIIKNLGHVRNI